MRKLLASLLCLAHLLAATTAHAGLFVNSYIFSTVSPITVTYLGALAWTTGSTITGNIDIGAADTGKEVFIVSSTVGSGAFRSITAASTTVASVSGTKFTSEFAVSSNGYGGVFIPLPTQAGSQAVTITYSGALVRGDVAFYAVLNRPAATNETDSQNISPGSVTSLTLSTVTINNNGIWLAVCVHNNSNATTAPTGTTLDADITTTTSTVAKNTFTSRGPTAGPVTPSDVWSWTTAASAVGSGWSFD